MSPVLHAAFTSWSVPWAPTLAIFLTALTYLRGWYLLRCAGFPLIPPWRVAAFLSGLLALWVALAGPMDVFNAWLLTAHMVQHMMLMMVAPPLILLGDPLIPLVRGLPIFAAREFAGPFLNWKLAQRIGRTLTQPVFALILMGVVMLGWHVPALYELAVRSPAWHQFEHTCFFVTSLLFWWPVVQPWPSTSHWPRWAMVPYLVIADLQNTLLSAALVFSDRILYPSYLKAPRVFGLAAREDQAAAGAIMWVVGSVAFLVPAMLIAVQCLTRRALPTGATRLNKHHPLFAGAWQRVMARFGIATSVAEAISFIAMLVLVGAAFSAALAFSGSDDDTVVRRAEQHVGGLLVSIYAPNELTIRTNNVSILVQNESQEPVLDAEVEVSATCDASDRGPKIKASDGDSENKLLHAASIDLPNAGAWLLGVKVRAGDERGEVAVPVQATVHQTGVEDWWPYLVFPVFGALLFFAYMRRAHRRPHVVREREMEAASHP